MVQGACRGGGSSWSRWFCGLAIVGGVVPALLNGPAFGQVLQVFEVPTPAARPYTITAGPDGNLWFTESVGNKIGRITPDGDITEFDVPTADSGPYGITMGADGAVWFTERFGNQIGRLDIATGAITEYPIPTPFAQPWEIAAGPDGRLWFTEEDVNQIGRISLTGQIVEFNPGGCCFPTGITAGADGNIWYTIEIGDMIGRMTTSGVPTVFTIPSIQVLAWDIAPGPDGHVWFTELAGRAIGEVTPDGQIVEHPVPGEFSGIAGIAAGPDGRLWFTENDTSRAGVMNVAGDVLRQGNLPDASRPLSVAHGPDGNLWVVLMDANAIGRIATARPGTAYVLSMDAGFSPRERVAALGSTVQWTFLGPRPHGVTDASGLGLFASGAKSIVSYFSVRAMAAGTFAYADPENPALTGEIRTPVEVPGQGRVNEPMAVRWAVRDLPGALVADVQVRTPGTPDFEDWIVGTHESSDVYTPEEAGEYAFRSRVRRAGGSTATGYSPEATVVVLN